MHEKKATDDDCSETSNRPALCLGLLNVLGYERKRERKMIFLAYIPRLPRPITLFVTLMSRVRQLTPQGKRAYSSITSKKKKKRDQSAEAIQE